MTGYLKWIIQKSIKHISIIITVSLLLFLFFMSIVKGYAVATGLMYIIIVLFTATYLYYYLSVKSKTVDTKGKVE